MYHSVQRCWEEKEKQFSWCNNLENHFHHLHKNQINITLMTLLIFPMDKMVRDTLNYEFHYFDGKLL